MKIKSTTRAKFPQTTSACEFLDQVTVDDRQMALIPYSELSKLVAEYQQLKEDNKDLTEMVDDAIKETIRWEQHAREMYSKHDDTDAYTQ